MKIAQSLGFFIGETCYPLNPIFGVSHSYEGDNPLKHSLLHSLRNGKSLKKPFLRIQKCMHSAHVSCFEVDAIFLSEPSSVYWRPLIGAGNTQRLVQNHKSTDSWTKSTFTCDLKANLFAFNCCIYFLIIRLCNTKCYPLPLFQVTSWQAEVTLLEGAT